MLRRLRSTRAEYPAQFWLLFVGMFISTVGSSMIWPFLTLYVSKKLSLPLTQAAGLVTINAAMGLIFSFIAGPITDRLGRKWVMVASLFVNGAMYLVMSHAETYGMFALCQAVMGAFNPLYRVGADAMMSDLIPPEQRSSAYSLMRTSNNLGVAIGPALGGFLVTRSYTVVFYLAAAGLILYSLLILLNAHETLPQEAAASLKGKQMLSGYGHIFRDREFITFIIAYTLTNMMASTMWVLMPVYTNQHYNVSESMYGWIPTTNAIMVVAFQYLVTRVTRRHKPLWVLTAGTAFYAIGTTLVAVFSGFWGFWLCMVIATVGELVVVPTATTFTANQAPSDMRGRYMSIYNLTSSIASAVAPVFGGMLNDTLGPKMIWYGAGVVGLLSVLAFGSLALIFKDAGMHGHSRPSAETV
jgi:MFS family permease